MEGIMPKERRCDGKKCNCKICKCLQSKKCKICGRGEMLTAEGTCVYCGYSPGFPMSKDWKKLQRELLPKQKAEDKRFAKRVKNFKKFLR